MRSTIGILCLILSVVFLTQTMFIEPLQAQPQRPERPKTIVPPSPIGVEKEPPAIKIWTDKGDNTNNNMPIYYVGELIYVSFQVNKDCYVTVYDIDSAGNVNILFPNPYHTDNFARAGRIYLIPTSNYGYNLIVKEPTGNEIVYAIASNHIYYHWQYGISPPPIWSDEWGTPFTWGHGGGYDSTIASRRLQKRLQNQPNMADLTKEFINHQIQLAKPTEVKSTECRFFVTFPPY